MLLSDSLPKSVLCLWLWVKTRKSKTGRRRQQPKEKMTRWRRRQEPTIKRQPHQEKNLSVFALTSAVLCPRTTLIIIVMRLWCRREIWRKTYSVDTQYVTHSARRPISVQDSANASPEGESKWYFRILWCCSASSCHSCEECVCAQLEG